MAKRVSYPGVYIEEIPSGVHAIVGASTAETAFVDVFAQGPVDRPVRITSMAEFVQTFGGLDDRSEASYGVSQFFLNGGQTAWIVRLHPTGASTASAVVSGISFRASSPGDWGNTVQVEATRVSDGTISVAVRQVEQRDGRSVPLRTEMFHHLTPDAGSRNIRDVINRQSELVRVTTESPIDDTVAKELRPAFTPLVGGDDGLDARRPKQGSDGSDTERPNPSAGSSDTTPSRRELALATVAELLSKQDDGAGMYALRTIAPDCFNLLCLPATAFMSAKSRAAIIPRAIQFCEENRAFFVVDARHDVTARELEASVGAEIENLSANAAVWYPTLVIPDAANENRPRDVASSGTMAGVIARTDADRGVWKAPAGTEATLEGAAPKFGLNDEQTGDLNQLGINCLRTFPIYGAVSWGARTLKGADVLDSEWKYVPVRRTALYLETSVRAGTKWVVFEPNDEPLWAQLRLSVGSFMHDLFREGAFVGSTPAEAYFVRCDRTTITQSDIDRGIVNVTVGFAPLKPAEFVVINIAQSAGS